MDLGKFARDFIIIFLIVSILFWVFDFIKKMFTKETAVAYWAMFLAVSLATYLFSKNIFRILKEKRLC
jgi:hypothetical protein